MLHLKFSAKDRIEVEFTPDFHPSPEPEMYDGDDAETKPAVITDETDVFIGRASPRAIDYLQREVSKLKG